MNVDWIRNRCLSFPKATEHLQWESLVFKVAGKIFAVAALMPREHVLSFKCTPEDFLELTENAGVTQAPYFARGQWVALESEDALPPGEISRRLRTSYDLVVAKLPKKLQADLAATSAKRRSK